MKTSSKLVSKFQSLQGLQNASIISRRNPSGVRVVIAGDGGNDPASFADIEAARCQILHDSHLQKGRLNAKGHTQRITAI